MSKLTDDLRMDAEYVSSDRRCVLMEAAADRIKALERALRIIMKLTAYAATDDPTVSISRDAALDDLGNIDDICREVLEESK